VRIEKTDTLEVVLLPRIGNTPPHVEIRQPKLGYLIYFPLDEVGQLRKALKRIMTSPAGSKRQCDRLIER
jgi:hypothetical protein